VCSKPLGCPGGTKGVGALQVEPLSMIPSREDAVSELPMDPSRIAMSGSSIAPSEMDIDVSPPQALKSRQLMITTIVFKSSFTASILAYVVWWIVTA
jgi:hypothetical protein